MTYRRLIIGDSGVARFWQASQTARPQLLGVVLKPVSCFDTLASALDSVCDEMDYAVISVLTGLLIEEGTSADVSGSCSSVLDAVVKRVCGAAGRSPRVEVKHLWIFALFRFT